MTAATPTVDAGATPQTRAPAWAIRHVPSHLRLWIAAVGGLTLDLWSKDWAFRTLNWNDAREIVPRILSFRLSLNPGALFGIGHGLAPIFVGASVLALMFVLYLFANSATNQRFLHIALGLVLAGAIGNLYDRITQDACIVQIKSAWGTRTDVGQLVRSSNDSVTIADFNRPSQNERTYPNRDWELLSYAPSPVVRDFIQFEVQAGGHKLYPWIFNVADAALVIGVGFLLVHFWGGRKQNRPVESQPTQK